jgi:hypothetical protein
MTSQTQWTRAIVLMPPPPEGRGVSDSLKSEFARRDWFVVEQHDPHLALSELCLRERAQAARSAWGLHRMEQVALVVVQPEYWRQHGRELDALLAAVVRYAPSAAIWKVVDNNVHPVHERANETPPSKNSASSPPPLPVRHDAAPSPRPVSAPPLKLAGNEVPRDSTSQSPPLRIPAVSENPLAFAAKSEDSTPQVSTDEDQPVLDSRITRQEIDMLLDMNRPANPSEAGT